MRVTFPARTLRKRRPGLWWALGSHEDDEFFRVTAGKWGKRSCGGSRKCRIPGFSVKRRIYCMYARFCTPVSGWDALVVVPPGR